MALAFPARASKYIGRELPWVASRNPRAFLNACKVLGITSFKYKYLDRYEIEIDVNGASVSEEILTKGSYQFELFSRLNEIFGKFECCFVNIGANIGTSCLNGHNIGFRDFVVFEPVDYNFQILKRNLSAIESDSIVSLNKFALGSKSGNSIIFLNPGSGGRHSLLKNFNGNQEEVEIKRLDDMGIQKNSFLWIDTEGYELEVLRGAKNIIDEYVKGICIEITPELHSEKDLEEISCILSNSFSSFYSIKKEFGSIIRVKDIVQFGRQVDLFCIK